MRNAVIQQMRLYKYTTYETAKLILTEQMFRYTQPFCFNDPFELYPIVEEYFTSEQFEEILNQVTEAPMINEAYDRTLRSEYDKLSPEQKSIIPYEAYYSIQKKRIQKEIQSRNLPLKSLVKEYFDNSDANGLMNLEYHKLINKIIGILSLSDKYDNILMWSHYTDSHTGVVIKLNSENGYFQNLNKVNYSNTRPKIRLSKRDYTQQESVDVYKKVFFNKSLLWSYESEYRDLKPLVQGKHLDNYDKNKFPIILFEFPIDIIDGVIFGARVDDSKIEAFISSIGSMYKNIEFEKVYLNKDKFKFDITPL